MYLILFQALFPQWGSQVEFDCLTLNSKGIKMVLFHDDEGAMPQTDDGGNGDQGASGEEETAAPAEGGDSGDAGDDAGSDM